MAGLSHAFSTKPHNVSPKPIPDEAACTQRRRAMARDFGLDPERLAVCIQLHTPKLAVATSGAVGRFEGFDGLVTNEPDIGLMTFSADCPLVLAFDTQIRALGMVHSSWRCTVGFSTRLLIERLSAEFGAKPADVWAGIGPSAGPNSYEVQNDVVEAARVLPDSDSLFHRRDDRTYFDLWEANRRQLIDAGVPASQIEVAATCTMERNDLFFSYRREGAGCGHFGLLAALRS